MPIRIAIHHRADSFSDRWIRYCREKSIDCCEVNAYDSNIICQMESFDAFLWHVNHGSPTDLLMAGHVLNAVETMGKVVFPNHPTRWHFDDKLSQKYLLESVGAPIVPSHVFFEQHDALEWLSAADYPVVAKLRRGAGSKNVRCLRDYYDGRSYCRRAFGRGFIPAPSYFADSRTKVRNIRDWASLWAKIQRTPKSIAKALRTRQRSEREKGYVLFQQFLPGNTYDTRVTVVGNRAWAFTRNMRRNDWRASGSGSINYDIERIDLRCIAIAFETSDAISTQCVAIDFLKDVEQRPAIVEISFGFMPAPVVACAGYWNRDLTFTPGHHWPQDSIVDNIYAEVIRRRKALL